GRRRAPVVDRPGGETQGSGLVLLRQSGAAVARDPDQQGAHRVLRRSQACAPQGLASLRVLGPRRRWPGTRPDPPHRRLGAHPQLIVTANAPPGFRGRTRVNSSALGAKAIAYMRAERTYTSSP